MFLSALIGGICGPTPWQAWRLGGKKEFSGF
jgi:hypothetical protein